jgi:UDP-glucose 4-epimerase
VKRSRIKPAVAWAAEKVGRLKLNGRLTERSPLTPLVELEGTAIGVAGKLRLWQALREVVDDESLRARLDELATRAERQLADLEPRRLAAAHLAARS